MQKNGKAGEYYKKRCREEWREGTESWKEEKQEKEEESAKEEVRGRGKVRERSKSESEAGEMPARGEAGERRRVGDRRGRLGLQTESARGGEQQETGNLRMWERLETK